MGSIFTKINSWSCSPAAKKKKKKIVPAIACPKRCECGHPCGGVIDEPVCFGCVICRTQSPCPICLEDISTKPAVRVGGCGHAAHMQCMQELLAAIDWRGKEIRPAELRCPAGCGAFIDIPMLASDIQEFRTLVDKASRVAKESARQDEVDEVKAEDEYRVFQCDECAQPYNGGLRQCGELEDANAKALCDYCRTKKTGACKIHGQQYLAYKCNYCCQVATFTCGGGGERFCTSCHIGAAKMYHEGRFHEWQMQAIRRIPDCEPATCPFVGAHPKGRTHAWHAPCSKCYMGKNVTRPQRSSSTRQAKSKKCETPGCNYAAASEAAGWNGHGRHCCAGCMKHGSYSTMRPNASAPPSCCHDHGRCERKLWSAR